MIYLRHDVILSLYESEVDEIKELVMVIPCYNEEANVERLYNEITDVMDKAGVDFEIIFVNDGSRDNTLAVMKKIVETTAHSIKVIELSRNFGKEAAMLAGLYQARFNDYIVILDGDMQHSPTVVLDMLNFLKANPDYDCVAAVQEKRREGLFMRACKKAFYGIINRSSSVDFTSDASDFRMMRQDVLEAYLDMEESLRFSKGIFSYIGFKTYYMPYQARERGGGTSKFPFFRLLRYAFDGINSFSEAPLKLAYYAGGLFFFAFLAYLVFAIVRLCMGLSVTLLSVILLLVLFIGGCQMVGLGILGEYIGKTYVETKARPVFFIRNIYDSDKKEK